MSGRPLVIVGAAGTGRETIDIVEAINARQERFHLLGVLDDFPSQPHLDRLRDRAVPFLGSVDGWIGSAPPPTQFVVAIAAPAVREKLTARLEAAGHRPAALVHPAALIGSETPIPPGAIIYGGAQLSTNVRLGRCPIINMNAVIGHDCVLGDFVSVNPGATVSGEVRLSSHVLVGGRATVLQGLTVGAGSVIGAAALVTKDIPPHMVVTGIPGRWRSAEPPAGHVTAAETTGSDS